jgi:hypothetical protein
MRILVQGMNISIANALRIMVLEDLRYKSYVLWRGNHVGGKQDEAGLAQGEPLVGVGQGGLAFQLT